jgi:hypothetical protein
MKRYAGAVYLVIALLAVGIAGCNNDSLPPASGYAGVSGIVVDSATNAPVAGALITIDTILTATTDSAGKFSIDKVPSGIADYAVTAKGYQTLAASANVEPGKPLALNLTLVPQSPH